MKTEKSQALCPLQTSCFVFTMALQTPLCFPFFLANDLIFFRFWSLLICHKIFTRFAGTPLTLLYFSPCFDLQFLLLAPRNQNKKKKKKTKPKKPKPKQNQRSTLTSFGKAHTGLRTEERCSLPFPSARSPDPPRPGNEGTGQSLKALLLICFRRAGPVSLP